MQKETFQYRASIIDWTPNTDHALLWVNVCKQWVSHVTFREMLLTIFALPLLTQTAFHAASFDKIQLSFWARRESFLFVYKLQSCFLRESRSCFEEIQRLFLCICVTQRKKINCTCFQTVHHSIGEAALPLPTQTVFCATSVVKPH